MSSPVTEADLAADRIIAAGLARIAPQIPSLSEERLHEATPPYRGCFFLIDPLDGTKEFVAGRNEFTVNLALVSDGKPLLADGDVGGCGRRIRVRAAVSPERFELSINGLKGRCSTG